MSKSENRKVSGPSSTRYYARRMAGLAKANKDKRIKAHQAFVVRKEREHQLAERGQRKPRGYTRDNRRFENYALAVERNG